MANLDSILKSRDITLPTKVRLVKAMGFPVAMCGSETDMRLKQRRSLTMEILEALFLSTSQRHLLNSSASEISDKWSIGLS